MKQQIHIKIYASMCGRNDFFLERVRNTAESLGLTYTLEKVTDEAEIEAQGLQISCLYAYCPGCKALHACISGKCTPAMTVNGELKCYNVPPDDDALRELLAVYQ